MAYTRIYPITIIPKFTSRNTTHEIQSLSTNPNAAWENVCESDNSIICWGDVNPDAVDRNNPVYSANFYNTITTESGSFDTPTPFTTSGWKDSIPYAAKIQKIDVEYAWDQVIYTRNNNCVTWHGQGCEGHYDSAGGYFKYPPKITLSIAGKNLTVTGPNVNPSGNCTYKNDYQYSESELKSCGVNIPGVAGLRGSDLNNATITFTPGKNYASDVARIVMRHIRLYVEYEDVPPAFLLEDAYLSTYSTSNCSNKSVTLNVKLKNYSDTKGQTQVKISGSGIANADYDTITTNKKLTGNDELIKEDNYYIWKVLTDCYERELSIDLSYNTSIPTGNYNVNVELISYRGTGQTKKNMKLLIETCKPDFNFSIVDADNNIITERKFLDSDEKQVFLKLELHRNQTSDYNDNLQIDMSQDGKYSLMSYASWGTTSWDIQTDESTHNITYKTKDNICTFSNIKDYKDIIIKRPIVFNESGTYNITGKYNNATEPSWNKSKTETFTITGTLLGTDYFKLRLEDGSDVRYNSLMITKGDDLLIPLTYTVDEIDKYVSNMNIYGETKRIPVDEAQYVYFTIDLDTEEEVELKNVLTYIEIYDANNFSDNILMGVGKNATLLETDNEYICSIHSISSKKSNIIKLAVKSSLEIEDVVIKIKPYNYDGYNDEDGWIPSHIMFKDIPNIKMSISGVSDITYNEQQNNDPNSYFELHYTIQNLSDVDAKNVRFQIEEPGYFVKRCYIFGEDNDCNDNVNGRQDKAWFNKNNRIITFPILEAHSSEKILTIKYQAKRKGIYDFVIKTLDNKKDLIDDQYENSYTHSVMVNIPNDVHITTHVSKTLPYINELLDFKIKIKNLRKKQDSFKFYIYDIGGYENIYDTNTQTYKTAHEENHYSIEYVKCKKGTFTPMPNNLYQYPESHDKNKIGTWEIEDIDIDDEYILTLTVRPQEIGNHVFKTIFVDQFNNTQDFYNEVKVVEKNKQLEFNVYHAISEEENTNCSDCDNLIQICDDDFINLGDDIFYVFEIKNNSRNPITNALHVYARLPESFLTNNICSNYEYSLNKENLISFTIPELPGCKHEDSTIKFCMKIQPSEVGKFVSNFSLSTRNSHVLHKQLHLTVDTEFNERKLEHEINIYNFEKTNKYYRYEIDNVGNIFKFYNTGDKTLRPVETEEYKKSAIETYRGTNLKNIVNQIKEKSKYVDPLFLRTGSNKLADKGYELFPDGFIRRFGLLNSEVFHYTGQLPITTDLVDRAMKWDIDKWDTKLWAGDIYDNGVFGLTVDYSKIPSNFNILDADNPIKNLQQLVDDVKPYGTKAICHYSATIHARLQINVDSTLAKIKHDINIHLILPEDFTVISGYNRYDDTMSMYYKLAKKKLNVEIKRLTNNIKKRDKSSNKINSKIDKIYMNIFGDKISRIFIEECHDLVTYIYSISDERKNIDITKPYKIDYEKTLNTSLSRIQIANFTNNIDEKEEIGFIIKPNKQVRVYTYNNVDSEENIENNIIKCIFYKDSINDFNGFKLILNDNIIEERNIEKNINDISIQIQTYLKDNKNILHFWGSVNKKDYYHIGLVVIDTFNEPVCETINTNKITRKSVDITSEGKTDTPVTFKISDKINIINKAHDKIYAIENKNKWQYLSNINTNKNKYAIFENTIDIDKECESHKINVPKLVLKYNNIDINDLDEIIDIKFSIEAQTNKQNFTDDVNINLFKDGDKYIPENETAREIIHPSSISNVSQDFITTFDLEQENITICSKCLKTSLGYHETCPYCGSGYVTYSNKKTPATVCYNCGWIINEWNDYCTHCLSYDVEKIQIDYNKTYCNRCGTLSPDYYQYCPQCFSSDVIHLTNNTARYKIFGEDKQNIEPISLYIESEEKYVDIFSLYIPFNKNTTELSQLKYLTLKIHGTNNNNGQYYYCEACGSAGTGNYKKCPYCNSTLINNKTISNYIFRPFYHSGNTDMMYEDMIEMSDKCKTDKTYNANISSGSFTKEIDLIKCACHNDMDKFKLIFRIENQGYEEIQNAISNLPIKDEYKVDIISELLLYDITIDNLSLDYKYKNEREWVNLNKIEGPNHTGISYQTKNKTSTDIINFNFNTEKRKYKHIYLYVTGLIKDIIDNTTIINAETWVNGANVFTESAKIDNNLFDYKFDILNPKHFSNTFSNSISIEDISVKIYFDNAPKNTEIIITDCHITTEYTKYKNDIHDDINVISSEFVSEHNNYLFKSLKNNLWGLNDVQPYYLSGKQLDTNLIAYIDFGKLDLQEYIRIYNINMLISYKAKNGNIITETIFPATNNNSFKILLKSIGYTSTEINTMLENGNSNEVNLKAALTKKQINLLSDRKQLLSGDIINQNSILWGKVNGHAPSSLYNLEPEISDIDEDDELLNDIPLYYQIAQAFNTSDYIDSIDSVSLKYFGQKGYPNNFISIYICKDNNGKPGNIIGSSKLKIDDIKATLEADLNISSLTLHTQYWIVIEDVSANKNNYHRFYHNNATNNLIGPCITNNKKHYTHQNFKLCFEIKKMLPKVMFNKLPIKWNLEDDDTYKIHYTLYRYNVQDGNNVSLSNFLMKSGYKIWSDNND